VQTGVETMTSRASTRRLTARSAAAAKPDRHDKKKMIADGNNLFLQVIRGSHSISRSWLFKYELNGRRHEMGLGPLDIVPLGEARDKARHLRRQLLGGVDPLAARHKLNQQRQLEVAKAMTFGQCVEAYLQAHDAAWKNAKHRQQWRATLTNDCRIISNLPVKDIDTDLVLRVLTPIWKKKTETARRLRARIERVLSWAKGRELRAGENPARWTGHLEEMLAAPTKVAKVRHHPALPYIELPEFMAQLRQKNSLSARALEFTILTAARTSETTGAEWGEFDLDNKGTWVIPAERMKAGRQHRVPLSNRCIEILRGLRRDSRPFKLSNMGMLQLLRGMRPGLTVQGFRSTFRDWAAEQTGFANHIVEQALAHTVHDKVEAAYRRGDLFEKRQRLMEQWADYCHAPASDRSAAIPLRK
jgi:integrase